MQRINYLGQDCWVDEDNNKWRCDFHSEEESERLSETLDGCFDCDECEYCTLCERCEFCKGCLDCKHCSVCIECVNCVECAGLDKEIDRYQHEVKDGQ